VRRVEKRVVRRVWCLFPPGLRRGGLVVVGGGKGREAGGENRTVSLRFLLFKEGPVLVVGRVVPPRFASVIVIIVRVA